jgi:hypothetical protein
VLRRPIETAPFVESQTVRTESCPEALQTFRPAIVLPELHFG